MAMLNPRILMQIPLLLLGSCVPVIPSTSITIYTTPQGYPQAVAQVSKPADQPAAVVIPVPTAAPTPIRDCVLAVDHEEKEPLEIPLPDMSKAAGQTKEELNKAVVDLLISNLKQQRAEVNRLLVERRCLIAELRSRRAK